LSDEAQPANGSVTASAKPAPQTNSAHQAHQPSGTPSIAHAFKPANKSGRSGKVCGRCGAGRVTIIEILWSPSKEPFSFLTTSPFRNQLLYSYHS
jgi:hypothetical protein